MSVRPALAAWAVLLPLLVAVPTVAVAQAATDPLVEPREYGTDERHDPLDYDQATDLMTDPDVTVGVSGFRQGDGRVDFTAAGPGGSNWYVSPVWMTFPHHIDAGAPESAFPDADGGALHDQHDGLALPVDADTYSHLSIRFRANRDPGRVYVSWFGCQEWLPQCQGMMELKGVRGGWNSFNVALENTMAGSGLPKEWRGEVYGLRFQGVVEAETTFTLDWFRLYDGDSRYDVQVAADRNTYVFSDRPVFGGSDAKDTTEVWGQLRPVSSSSPFHVNVGGLPPGQWYVFDETGTPMAEARIVARPRPEILDPDMAGGADYATEVLGNPWDFEDGGDYIGVGNSTGVRRRGGELSAVNTSNDPYVQLPLGPDGLDPVHYHRVTVDQHYDSNFNLDDGTSANNPIPGGSHGRLLWRTPQHPQDWRECAHTSDGREMVFYKTWDVYTYDMRDVPASQGMISSAEPNIGVTYCTVTGPDPHWTANGAITSLRFDPHELPTQYRWYVDDLRIAADDAADPTFDIRWKDHKPIEGTRVTVRLDDDRSGYDGEELATVTQSNDRKVNTVTFDATDRLPGTYWVNLTSTAPDGRVGRDYATGPLQVSPRLHGSDRVATSVDVSRQSFDAARTAIVASAENFPDALVAVQLADAVEGPVLLTGSSRLDGRVRTELQRLGVREVVIAGGETAVTPKVATGLVNAGFDVTRIGGATRYETATALAREAMERRGVTTASRVLVTTGENFPDALAAGPFVGHSDTPLVLARPAQQAPPGPDGEVPPPTVPADDDAARDFLAEVDATRATFLGGPVALTDQVVEYVADGRAHDRIEGNDRFVTARKLTEAAVDAGGSAADVLIATGRNFPDALSAGAAALARGGVLVLTEKDRVPSTTRTWLRDVDSWHSWRVVGGPVAVSHATVRRLEAASGL